MARSDRKQREFEQREQDILDAALTLFSTPEWETVTIDQIARAADIGKGTVYKHFSGKDELLMRLMLRFYQGLLLRLKREFRDSVDVLKQFRLIFELAFRYHLEHREYRYIVEYCNRIDFKERADESWRDSFMQLDRAFGDWGDPLFLTAMEQGRIQKRPIEQIRTGLHACFEGTINMLWAGRDWCTHGDEEEIIQSSIAFMMSGLIGRV